MAECGKKRFHAETESDKTGKKTWNNCGVL